MAPNQVEAAQELNLGMITQMNAALAQTRILLTAVQLGIFSHIAAGKTSVAEIASAADCSTRGIRMMLNALCAFGLLVKTDERYGLHAVARQYLVRGNPDYMGYMLESDNQWDFWGRLTGAVRTGMPVRQTQDPGPEKFFSVLVRSLHVMNAAPAKQLADAVGAGSAHKGMRVLDVGCGSGVWGIAMAEADPGLRVTFQDLPAVLAITREYVERHRLTGEHAFLPGNIEEVDLGESAFELAVLGNICHGAGERTSRELFKHIRRALCSGGRIAIVDTLPNEERTGRAFPLVFALNMLLHTEHGDTFTLREYSEWLREAGYDAVTTAEIGLNSPAILATK